MFEEIRSQLVKKLLASKVSAGKEKGENLNSDNLSETVYRKKC